MEEFIESEAINSDSINSGDRGYVSLELDNQGAGCISTQLVPEFSRKLSFVEYNDDVNPGGISDNSLEPQFCDTAIQLSHGDKSEVHEAVSTIPDTSEIASTVLDASEISTGEMKHSFVCLCGEHFEKSVQLAAHKRWSCKLKEKTAQCDICKNWFASDMGLKRHMKHAHGGAYCCNSCSLRFPNKIKLTRHWMEAHYDESKDKSKMLKCFECGYTNFDNKFELECHLVLHKFEKHQLKLQTASMPHHTDMPFSPYHSPPFMRGMRPHHPFHHPYGFGHPWSHFPFRPPPPLFPFMPCSSYAPFRPPFPPPPRPYPFPTDTNPYTSVQDDDSSLKSSSKASTINRSSMKEVDEVMTSGVGRTDGIDRSPHHNHEYIEPTAFQCLFHPPFDHNRHHHRHHDHHGKRKWKKYLKLMMKGKVPPLLTGLAPQDLNTGQFVQSQENQVRNHGDEKVQEKDTNTCEFKMVCKFCDKVIEKNNVLRHQRKECPVLLAHQCSVCDRVFKKRHFLVRHMHEHNHFPSGSSQTGQNSVDLGSLSSLQEKMNASLQLLNFSENAVEKYKSDSLVKGQMQAHSDRNTQSNSCTDANINMESRSIEYSLRENSDAIIIEQLQCITCKHVCRTIEDLTEHLKEHINLVLAVQKVREWTNKSSDYFFLGNHDDEELDGSGSVSTGTTSFFDSEITSVASSAVQELGSTFSSLETAESKWIKPHKKRSKHRHKGEITVCEFCSEKFAFRKDLRYHMETNHKNSTLECPVCQKTFSWKKRGKFYERHLNSHYGVKIFKHKCEACGKTFLENSKLRAHMSLHNSELLHKCTVCAKGYANKSSLVRHERKHTGMKPYQCEICQESFMEKRELLRHSTTHTGLAPFNCDECGQGFTLKTSLMSHVKKKHSKKDKSVHS